MERKGEASTIDSKNGNRKKKDEKVAFYKLFSFADKLDVGLMCVGTICGIANGISQPLMTVIFGQLINSFGVSTQANVVNEVSKISMKYVYLAIFASITGFFQVSCWIVTGERQSARIRSLYLKTILRQDISFFDTKTTTGEVIERMSGDTILIQNAMGEKVGKFIQLISTVFGGLVVAFVKGWHLAVVLLGCIPLLVITCGIMSMIQSKMSSRSQIAYAEAGNVIEQTIGAIRTVASFTGEKHAIKKYNDKLKAAYKATVHQGLASGLGVGAAVLVIYVTHALAIWYGSKLVINNGYSGGLVINVFMAIMMGGSSLGQTSPSWNAFVAGQAAAYKMFETIQRQPQIDVYNSNGIVLDDMSGEIELEDIYFRYPARPDVYVLSGLSLCVPSGTTAALVGQSGSGKSTVISLIERFYDPNSGSVLIDGINMKEFKLSWIREKIGLVSQEPILFATSMKENITYGKATATYQEIRTALELANAAKFIDRLPEGLDTMVGEYGMQVSGGQKQRIAIARAILKDPRILLLDEATSALDAESERIVQDALEKFMSDRTTIIVAHRLSTIKNADLIAVVQEGKIVEKGVHSELTRNPDGAYSQLIRLQERSTEFEDSLVIEANKLDTVMDIECIANQRFGSPRQSFHRSISRGSPTHNTRTFGVPNQISTAEGDHRDDPRTTKKMCKEVSLKRLAYLNKPEFPIILLGSVASAIFGVHFPLSGLLFSAVANTFFEPPHELRKHSNVWAIVYLCLGIINLLALSLQNFMFGIAGGKLIERIRSKTFEKVVYQEITWFDDPANSSGAVGARLSIDASTIRSIVGDALALHFQNAATIIVALIIGFVSNWILAFIILALSPLMFVQSHFEAKYAKGFSADAKLMYEEASQVANDALSSIRTVASFCAENKVMEIYQQKCYGPVKHGIRLGILSGLNLGFSLFIMTCIQAFCFYIGSLLIQHGKATFKEVFGVYFAISMAAFGLSQTTGMSLDNVKAKDSAASIFAILDKKSAIDSSNNDGITLPTVNGDIKFEHVSFKYPMRPDVQIFKDLSLSIPSGMTVALVGESGSGKSTIINLIERFYDPDSGHVYLDSVEIKKLKVSWLRQQIGLVSQEPILFNETIRANIAYGKEGEVSEEEIIAATTSSNAHKFISTLPHGYNTNVGERGVQLSGGQKQRIAIARAILNNPKIILLDEATSALDAESERIVQDALDRVMQNRTTIVVAHRLTTIKNADNIAVVKNGVIVENGKHDMLIKITDGAYASLVSLHMIAT